MKRPYDHMVVSSYHHIIKNSHATFGQIQPIVPGFDRIVSDSHKSWDDWLNSPKNGMRIFRTLSGLKKREDASNFGDSWTKSIAAI